MAKRMKEKSAKRLENRDTRPTATARYVRMGAPKAKRLLDIIKNKPAVEACAILDITPSTASIVVKKVLCSAIANAENKNMDTSKLYVAECYACQGPTLKRIRPRAQGRAFRINKKTSHITLVLKEAE